MRNKLLGAAAAALLATAFAASPASAAPVNIVTNGSFETSDFTGWTLTGADQGDDQVFPNLGVDGYSSEDGDWYAQLGDNGGTGKTVVLGTLGQTVTDEAGNFVYLNYFLGSANGGYPPEIGQPAASFSALWNGVVITGSLVGGSLTTGYDEYQFTVLGTGSDKLSFQFVNPQDDFNLDNVSAVVPEPATLAMFGAGLLGLAGLYRRRSSKA